MFYEMLVGLDVVDDQQYGQYRAGMEPILSSYSGRFGFDFKVSKVLRSETSNDINRVFTIRFPAVDSMNRFFSDPEYLKLKACYFDSAVGSTSIISSYEKTEA